MRIAVNQAASGLDIFLRYQGTLTDPLAISYVIYAPPTCIPVGSGAGYRRSVGWYDARNTVIPSGYDITESWKITWTFTSPAGIVSQKAEEFEVVDHLDPSFSNLDNLIDQIKLDLGLSNEYTQEQYETFAVKALNRLNRRLGLTGTSAQLSFNEDTGTIVPTPNASMYDLVLLQIECLIVKQTKRSAVAKGIRVRDGDSEIDTTAGFGGYDSVVKDICGELDDAIEDSKWTEGGVLEADSDNMIIWYGNSRIYAEMDHDGEGSGESRDYSSPFDSLQGYFPRR